MSGLTLSSPVATVIFVIACVAGVQFRRVWKEEGPRSQLWVFGLISAICFAVVALIPLGVVSR